MSRALNEHQIEQATKMRESGASWRQIGRVFGVKETTVQCAVDPIAAERERNKLRAWRQANGVNGRGRKTEVRRDPRVVMLPIPKPLSAKPFMTTSGVLAYRVKIDGVSVTLPFVAALDRKQAR